MKYEKVRPRNPLGLTIEQHVIPVRSIQRFAAQDGLVEVRLVGKRSPIRVRPKNGLFRTRRTWDQKTERVFMKQIEDRFQALADTILDGQIQAVEGADAQTVNLFYALWYERSRIRRPQDPFVTMDKVHPSELTKDQQEALEANGVSYYAAEGMPTRFLIGLQLKTSIGRYARQIRNLTWGVITCRECEFLMPDMPSHWIIPITPQTSLIAPQQSGEIGCENVAEINAALIATSSRYFFARDLRTACSGVTWDAIQKAGLAYERALARQESSPLRNR